MLDPTAIPIVDWLLEIGLTVRLGLTLDRTRAAAAAVPPYPHMIRWLRAEAD